jgi:hypothetical protein
MKEELEILRKINITKGYLLTEDFKKDEIIKLLNELFTENETKEDELEKVECDIKNGNIIPFLNKLNNWKEIITKNIFKNPCSKEWHKLIETDDNNLKYCSDCRKNVYLVKTEEELIIRKNLEQCVAIDSYDLKINKENDKNYKSCHIEFKSDYDESFRL